MKYIWLLLLSNVALGSTVQNTGRFRAEGVDVQSVSTQFEWLSDYSALAENVYKTTVGYKQVQIDLEEERSTGREFNLGLGYEWSAYTETNLTGSYAVYSGNYQNRTLGLQHSHWLNDQFQASLALTKSYVNQEEAEILRDDLAEILIPNRAESTSGTISFKMLLNPTTTWDFANTFKKEHNRPLTKMFSMSVKIYWKLLKVATHLDGSYAESKGDVSKSDKGELESYSAKASVLFHPWRNALLTTSYRYYVEKETLYDEYIYGSDLAQVSLKQDFDIYGTDVYFGGLVGRYLNNEDVEGWMFALQAKLGI